MVGAKTKLRIGKRDRLILWHVYRFGLTHKQATYRLFYDPNSHQLEAARKTLRRLTEGGYLNYYRDPWPHFRLALPGARLLEHLLGLPIDALRPTTRPITAVGALFRRCALLAFCCLSNRRGTLLTRPELEHWFADFTRLGIRPWPFYIDDCQKDPVLRYLVVDSGSDMQLQIRRVDKCYRQHLSIPAIRGIDQHGRYRTCWLTHAAQRAEEFQVAMMEAGLQSVEVIQVPEVLDIAPNLHLQLRRSNGRPSHA